MRCERGKKGRVDRKKVRKFSQDATAIDSDMTGKQIGALVVLGRLMVIIEEGRLFEVGDCRM
jgi:hypothetical protein